MRYLLAIDQSTSGTKAILFDGQGALCGRYDVAHAQKISPAGWVSHDPEEIYRNLLEAVRGVCAKTAINKEDIAAVGISNQRETTLLWDRDTGKPVADAVVWQCTRGASICEEIAPQGDEIRRRTGLPLSPYFSAAKLAWLLREHGASARNLCGGTMDSYLLFRLTGQHKTDASNASRTQLMNLHSLAWDGEICAWFGIDPAILPAICDSNAHFGDTDFEGFLPRPIPVHGVLGDSHGALYGQGCHQKGMGKVTYGTGSSVMVHIGEEPLLSEQGLVTSLAWQTDGKPYYVLEGNINYTGAVIKWLVEDVGLIESAREAGPIAASANPEDSTYLVPAFTGLGAPHWKSDVRAMLYGMSRSTGRAEIVRAAEESIAYQVADVIALLQQELADTALQLRVDGGPTKDSFLMQFQSDLLDLPLSYPAFEELSGMGAAYLAGIACGMYTPDLFDRIPRRQYVPAMTEEQRRKKYDGWKQAVQLLLRA